MSASGRGEGIVMFVIVSQYIGSLEAIDALMPEHRRWSSDLYAAGIMILSGRRVPRVGGLMLAAGVTRDVLEGHLAADPFRAAGLLTHEVFEFQPTQSIETLSWLKDNP